MKNSDLIIPISIVIHLCIINGVLFYFFPINYSGINIFYFSLSWLLIAFSLNFYPTGRQERFMTNLHKLFQQYIIFGLFYVLIIGSSKNISSYQEYYVLVIIFSLLTVFRGIFYYARGKYRLGGGNYVKVVVIGRDRNLKKIRKVFDQKDFGYRYVGYFDDTFSGSKTYLGKLENSCTYILENDIDEIYCTASVLPHNVLQRMINFADNNLKKIKVIPDNKEIFSRAMSIELYENIPVINLRKMPLEKEYARIGKRIFDLFFSSLVITLLLSWLIPILFVIIKLESKGPLFFKQKRPGLNKSFFWCYKFRSMAFKNAGEQASTLNDARVTKIGKILRKTSLDELPQFFNVFLGQMSVVGPRPHMQWQNEKYQVSVDKFLVRQFVKPGITGLAQVKGYRGEIVTEGDIINRVRMDIFYLEKWSLQLDLKIIYSTVANVVSGEEKAY